MPHGFVPVPDAREWCDVGVRMRRNAVISSDAEILQYVCMYVLYFCFVLFRAEPAKPISTVATLRRQRLSSECDCTVDRGISFPRET